MKMSFEVMNISFGVVKMSLERIYILHEANYEYALEAAS